MNREIAAARGALLFVAQMVLLVIIALSCLHPNAWRIEVLGGLWQFIGALVLMLGLVEVLLGLVSLGRVPDPLPDTPPPALVQRGLYARIRHPLYGGLILVALGAALYWRTPLALVFTGLLTQVLRAKARLEEEFLMERFPDYMEYRSRTRLFW